MTKLYSVYTKGGYILYQDVTLEEIEKKLSLSLNDFIDISNLQELTTLNRQLKVNLPKEIQNKLYSGKDAKKYLVHVQRVV